MAQSDAFTGEFRPLRIQQFPRKIVVKDFLDLGPAGIVLEVQVERMTFFQHLRDIS